MTECISILQTLINTCRKVHKQVNFFRWRHFALVSIKLISPWVLLLFGAYIGNTVNWKKTGFFAVFQFVKSWNTLWRVRKNMVQSQENMVQSQENMVQSQENVAMDSLLKKLFCPSLTCWFTIASVSWLPSPHAQNISEETWPKFSPFSVKSIPKKQTFLGRGSNPGLRGGMRVICQRAC